MSHFVFGGMAHLVLLEDIAARALRRERIFRERTDMFAESDEWLFSYANGYTFKKHFFLASTSDSKTSRSLSLKFFFFVFYFGAIIVFLWTTGASQ